MELNGLYDKASHLYLHEDVKQYLKTLPSAYFDLVIMDPPTFSNSKRMEDFLDIQRDHPALINQTLSAIKPGVFCISVPISAVSNYRPNL